MKIIKVISLIIVVLLFSWKPTLPDLTKRDRIKQLKKYGFYLCMEHNQIRIDSTFRFSNDHIGGVIFFHYELEGLEKTKDFVTKNAQFEFPNGLLKNEMSDPKANLICLDCFDFYKSKALHRFVRKMERELRE